MTAARRHQATVVAEGELSVGDLILVDTGLLVHHLHPSIVVGKVLGSSEQHGHGLVVHFLHVSLLAKENYNMTYL